MRTAARDAARFLSLYTMHYIACVPKPALFIHNLQASPLLLQHSSSIPETPHHESTISQSSPNSTPEMPSSPPKPGYKKLIFNSLCVTFYVLLLCLLSKKYLDEVLFVLFVTISGRTIYIFCLVLHSLLLLLDISVCLGNVLAERRRKKEREERQGEEMPEAGETRLSGDTERGSEHLGRTSKDSSRSSEVSGRTSEHSGRASKDSARPTEFSREINRDLESARENHADKSSDLPSRSPERANEQSKSTHERVGRASNDIEHADEGFKQATPRSPC
jgi:hypothetical protein